MTERYGDSPTLKLIKEQGWDWKAVDSSNIELETCWYCNKKGYGHLYVEIQPTTSRHAKRDGLHTCHKCGRGGNLTTIPGYTLPKRAIAALGTGSGREPLPDIEACHQALLDDEDALEYLMVERGWSLDIIQKQKLGVTVTHFRETGEVKALVFPYLVNGTAIWAKYRTLPSLPLSENKIPKAFSCPHGYDTVLYNGECLNSGFDDIILVEGEADCITALGHGITNICGVPGANNKKAEWISELDKSGVQKVYLCYDNDKVGQTASRSLANRIGIERCYKLVVPVGKDLNEWFAQHGGTLEAFNALKADAKQFDVDGVASEFDAVQEVIDEIKGKGSIEPKYRTPWGTLNILVGFDEGDVIDLLAAEKIGKTSQGLILMDHMVKTYGENGTIICLEMTRARMARKWISHLTGYPDLIPRSPEESVRFTQAFMDAADQAQREVAKREGRLYFCYPQYKTVDDIYNTIRDCIRRYGSKWIMLDNLQRLCDTTVGNKNRTQHLSEISKVTSQITKDYKIQMLRILQPHRIQQGKMVNTDNTDGSSQIAKDCDVTITLHRDRIEQGSLDEFQSVGYVQGEGTFSPKMVVTVGLSRYSAGGHTTLYYDGARCQISEIPATEITNLITQANKNVGYDSVLRSLNIAPKGTKPAVQEVSPEITL